MFHTNAVLAHGIPPVAVVGPFVISCVAGALISWMWWRGGKRSGRSPAFQIGGLVAGLVAIPIGLGIGLLYLVMWILYLTGSILWPF